MMHLHYVACSVSALQVRGVVAQTPDRASRAAFVLVYNEGARRGFAKSQKLEVQLGNRQNESCDFGLPPHAEL